MFLLRSLTLRQVGSLASTPFLRLLLLGLKHTHRVNMHTPHGARGNCPRAVSSQKIPEHITKFGRWGERPANPRSASVVTQPHLWRYRGHLWAQRVDFSPPALSSPRELRGRILRCAPRPSARRWHIGEPHLPPAGPAPPITSAASSAEQQQRMEKAAAPDDDNFIFKGSGGAAWGGHLGAVSRGFGCLQGMANRSSGV